MARGERQITVWQPAQAGFVAERSEVPKARLKQFDTIVRTRSGSSGAVAPPPERPRLPPTPPVIGERERSPRDEP